MNRETAIKELADECSATLTAVREEIKEILSKEVVIDKAKDPVKVLEKIDAESDFCITSFQEELKKGFQCYLDLTRPDEKEGLRKIVQKIEGLILAKADNQEFIPLGQEDFEFLDRIATRVLENNLYQEAALMWRWIILLNFTYARAWVGWAVSEQLQEHLEACELIYNLGLESLFYHPYVASYAADFFVSQKQQERAKEILDKALKGEDLSQEVVQELKQQMASI